MAPTDQFSHLAYDAVVVPCPSETKQRVHWIEIELLGEDGWPVPYEEYSITVPGKQPVTGLLSADGFARIENIENPGECEVIFPNLDRHAVRFEVELGAKAAVPAGRAT